MLFCAVDSKSGIKQTGVPKFEIRLEYDSNCFHHLFLVSESPNMLNYKLFFCRKTALQQTNIDN